MPMRKTFFSLLGVSLGVTFVLYGLVKLLGGQFVYHHDWVIDGRTTDGATLVWCFYGYSPTYGRLIGLAEALPGLLLLFRRTRLLGALVLLPIAANVTVMDFCFDFPPVKYFALALTAGCAALVAAERGKLRAALGAVLAAEPKEERSWLRWAVFVPPGLLVAFLLTH
jgi:hypothetical protein